VECSALHRMTSQFDDVFGEEISRGGRHFVVDQRQTLVRILNVMQMPRLLNVQLVCGGLTRRYHMLTLEIRVI
jgi:hypothetical protein